VKQKILGAFANLANSIAAAVPKIAVGILLVIAAFVVAKLIEIVLRYTLTRVRFDKLMEKAGIDKALQRIGLRQELNVFLPRLAYFLVLFILAKTAADALGLIAISSAIGAFFSYLPNLVAALLLLILGASLGRFAGDMVAESARNSGLDFAPSLGKLVSGLVVFVASMMAIAELRINTEIIHIVTSFILGGAALGFGISFGLGTRDIIRNITAGFYTRKFLQIGRQLEILGQRGILSQINATHTILQAEEREISVANAAFLENVSQSSSASG
jgi:Conserved TM helix/Mechanosensitive ion channel